MTKFDIDEKFNKHSFSEIYNFDNCLTLLKCDNCDCYAIKIKKMNITKVLYKKSKNMIKLKTYLKYYYNDDLIYNNTDLSEMHVIPNL